MATHNLAFLGLLVLFFAHLVHADNGDNDGDVEDNKDRYIKEIQCYALPYGGLGFLSHLLTYYAFGMQYLGRRPLMPWAEVEYSRSWNLGLALLKFIMTSVPCIYTMAHCSHDWEFQAIAAMKLGLSLTSVLITGSLGHHSGRIWALELLPYALAAIPSTVGTIFLSASYFTNNMKIVTSVFAAAGFLIAIGGMMWTIEKVDPRNVARFFFCFMFAIYFGFMWIIGALWSDWVLAIIADNLVGSPFEGNKTTEKAVRVLWVVYWIGKRLGLFVR